jgi:hypothetical protein
MNERMIIWACTESGRKQNSKKSIVYGFGNKIERQTKKQMAR